MVEQRTNIDFNPEKLQKLAHKLSQHFWNKDCDIPVVWNGRLSSTMGRFLFKTQGKKPIPLKIELSKHATRFINREVLIAVLLHELSHYHLFIQGQPYQDHHPTFEKELRRVGAISTNTVQIPQKGFKLYCSKCSRYLGTRKRMNSERYRSGCCREKINKKDVWLGDFKYEGKIFGK